MRTKLLLLYLFFGFKLSAQVVNIPDTNFKNYLVSNPNINTNGDNEIQITEANSYTAGISVQSLNISDLTGIEAFINLVDLNCRFNSLSSIDVSHNVNLESLSCDNNQLTAIDISNNLKLEGLVLSFNQITDIDLSNNTDLKLLIFGHNPLSNISISANLELTHLDLTNNQLNTIDVSNNTKLIVLTLPQNQISVIDVSKNLLLQSLTLRENNFSSIDVSKNTNLKFLACDANPLVNLDVSNNLNLEVLDIAATQLSSVDVSVNTSLRGFSCHSSTISELNIANGNNTNFVLFTALNCPNLSCITVDDVSYSNANWPSKDTTASYNTSCSVLSLTAFENDTINLFPNPTTSVLNIRLQTPLKQATIYSILGVAMVKSNATTIDVSSLKKGTYLIRIENSSGNSEIKRFIKQ